MFMAGWDPGGQAGEQEPPSSPGSQPLPPGGPCLTLQGLGIRADLCHTEFKGSQTVFFVYFLINSVHL